MDCNISELTDFKGLMRQAVEGLTVEVGGEVMDIKSKREDWKRRLPPSRRDIVSPLCR